MKVKASVANVPLGLKEGAQRDVARLKSLGVKTPRDAADVVIDCRRPMSDRATCCWAIMVSGSAELIPDLLVAYRGPASLTWEIAKALTVLGDEKIVPLLETLATRDVSPTLRAASAYALGYLGTSRSGKILAAALKGEKSRRTRQAIVEAVGRLGGKGAKVAIEAALADPAPYVRASACYAAGLLRLRHLVPKLLAIAAERRGWEAKSAEDALAMLRTS